jgi:L-ascorbate metabolism protein UlaG (beta-lactamase superfamily)
MLVGIWPGWLAVTHAQPAPQFTGVQLLANKEMALTLSTPTNRNYRIETAPGLPIWNALVTLPASSATSLQYTDSAAPYLDARFYRAVQLTVTNAFTGDHLATTNGDAIIHALFHASFVVQWNGKVIYCDPATDPAYLSTYQGLPKADLVLVTHSHSDHLSTTQIDAVRGTNAVIVAPQAVYGSLTAAQKAIASVLPSGTSTNLVGLTIDAIPAYNSYHPLGTGNGYVLTLGGKRIYVSGDTGNVAEMRALRDIEVAFVCINQPFTMTVSEATNAVRAFRPKVVYPYHYRDQSGTTTSARNFKQQLGTDLGIEVRLRKWY